LGNHRSPPGGTLVPVSWVEHRGHSVLYVDYRGLDAAECLATLREQGAAVDAAPGPVLTLVNARGVKFGSEFLHAAKIAGPKNTPRTHKRAVIGAEGLGEVVLGFFNLAAGAVPMVPFQAVEEALDYLVEP
jgi:hypothetical protein